MALNEVSWLFSVSRTSDWAIPALFVRPNDTDVLPLRAEVPAKESTLSPLMPEPIAKVGQPGFVQNVQSDQVGKQTNVQGGTVYYHEES